MKIARAKRQINYVGDGRDQDVLCLLQAHFVCFTFYSTELSFIVRPIVHHDN